MATNNVYPSPGELPAYRAPVQQSSLAGYSPGSGAVVKHKDGYYANGGGNYSSLAAASDKERQMNMQRAAERQNAVIGGYDQQMVNSRLMGQQGYDRLEANYSPITADALATRERNMARVDQYGNSMRSDLAIKNQQALAASRQSSIMRGLGNTTIQDSMVRGQNFDNTRQMMSLEDQLLQNRISTDANMSKNYQDTLQARAQGLANQWNQNTQNDNSLAGQRLGYIGGIQDDRGYTDIANIYQQGLQQDNANQQAALDRAFQQQQNQYLNPRTSGVSTSYSNVPAYGSFGPAGTSTNTGFVGGNNSRGFVGGGRR